MTTRTIEADVLPMDDCLIVIKSDELGHSDLQAMHNSLKKKGYHKTAMVLIGTDSSIESFTKQQAIEMLKRIIEKPEESK